MPRLETLLTMPLHERPDAPAVSHGACSLSYRELHARADSLARQLVSLGVKPDSRVGVCVPRSLELAVSLLGVIKSGAAYVPLDPAYPRDRLELMIADAGLEAL